MIRRRTKQRRNNNRQFDEDEDIIWCSRCLSHGDKCKMGEKILLDGQLPKPDDDQFVQCHQCYFIQPLYKASHEGDLYTDLDIETNPFDFAKSVITGDDNTLKGRLKRVSKQRKKHENQDKELARLRGEGWEITAFSEQIPQDTRQ